MKAKNAHLLSIFVPVLALIAATFSIGTFAQEDEDANQASDDVEEVIVTAQRRDTNLQTTPIAASVLSGADMRAKGVDQLVNLQFATPSVTIADYGSAQVFNIRGIGRTKVDIEVPSGVVTYADGIPSIAGYFLNEPYYDIEAVEVLRGPQGTFVGKSASGGAVFVRTNDPDLERQCGTFEFGFGEHDLWQARGAVNMPVNDTLAFRAAFNYENRDTWYNLTGPYTGDPGTRDLKSLRLGMLYQPNEKLSVLAKLNLADLDFGGNVTAGSNVGDLFSVHQDAPFFYVDETSRFTLDIDYEMDNGITFSSLTGYQTVDTQNDLDLNGGVEEPTYWFLSKGAIDLWSQEFNLISDENQRLRWVLGLFTQKQKAELAPIDQNGFVFLGGDPFGIGQLPLDFPWFGTPWIKDEDDWAVFGHIVYDIRDDLEFEIGVRYSDYSFYQQTDFVFGFGDAPPVIPFDGVEGPDRQDFSEDSFDYKLALNWEKDDRNFIYGVVSRGHTSGSVNIFPPWTPYGEMIVDNYEAGWKAAWNDRQFLTQLAFYYENIEGYHAAFQDLTIPDSNSTLVRNAESDSTIYGIELTAQAEFGNFALDFGIGWNESELGDFTQVVNPYTGGLVNLSKRQFTYAPDFTYNLGFEFRKQLSDGAMLLPRLDWGWIADQKADLFEDAVNTLDSRGLLNLQIRWEQGNGPWYAVLWATNLLDEEYVAGVQNLATLYYPGPPRQSGIRIGRNF
jgi:iron complex outermembrane receptor protein